MGKIVFNEEQCRKRGKLTLKKPKVDIDPAPIQEPTNLEEKTQSTSVKQSNTFQIGNQLNIHKVPKGHFTVLTEFCRLIDDKILGAGYVLVFNANILKTLGYKFCEIIDNRKLPGRPFKKIQEKNINNKVKRRANLYRNELKPHFEAMITEWLISGDAEMFFRNSYGRSTKNAAKFVNKISRFAIDENTAAPAKYSIVEGEYRLKNTES